jgi:hypothetical protein
LDQWRELVRAASWRAVASRGLDTNEGLPLLEEAVVSRSVREVGNRLLCMHVTAAVAFGFPPERARNWLDRERLTRDLSATETAYLDGSTSRIEAIKMQLYSIAALGWTVGLCKLQFFQELPDNLISAFPNLIDDEGSNSFLSNLTFRPVAEIQEKRDLGLCLHWALVDAQVHLRDVKELKWLFPTIAQRQSLEWIFVREDWERVSLDT